MNTTSTPITLAVMVRLKNAAKAAKATYPELTYAQRLDAIAQNEFGARHFHEVQQRYKAQVASHVELNGAHYCRFCHLRFSDYDAGDRRLHAERHQRFEEAQLTLGFLPIPYTEREDMKRNFGYEQLYKGNMAEQRIGALAIILSHYDRSLQRAIENGYWHKHPCLTEYLPFAVANSTFLGGKVLAHLAEEFGEQSGVIEPGDTDWPADVPCLSGWSSQQAKASQKLREDIYAAYLATQATSTALPA